MSLRSAMSLALLAMLLAVGLVASILAYEVTLHEAGQFMDDQMRQIASVVDERTRPGAVGALQEPEDRFAITIWTPDHRRIVLSPTADGPEPVSFGFSNRVIGDQAWRVFVTRTDGGTVRVAQRMSARQEIAFHTALEVALPIVASAPLAWLVVTAVVARLLRPLTRLGQDIGSRGTDLKQPIPTNRLPGEVQPFVLAINGLVDRLQAALDQQRRFIADSAHQLRTPLAAMRLQIDNLAGAGLPDAATAPLREGMKRVATMLNQLLDLAKFDGRGPGGRPETVDLADLVTQSLADRVELADERGIDLGVGVLERCSASVVRADLELLVANVVDNAIRYTPPGGRVDCSVTRSDSGSGLILVEDTGPGVCPADLPRLTERFYRGASVDVLGSGLGLAIAKATAERNGLDLVIANRRGGAGLSVRIEIPRVFTSCRKRRERADPHEIVDGETCPARDSRMVTRVPFS